jgi:hypothetical protein
MNLQKQDPVAAQVVEVEGADEAEGNVRLVREAIDEARDLVRLEVALAREELKAEMRRAKGGAAAMGAAVVLAIAGLTMLIASIPFAAGRSWLAALLIGAGLVAGAGLLAFRGWRIVPHEPLPATRERLESSLRDFRDQLA